MNSASAARHVGFCTVVVLLSLILGSVPASANPLPAGACCFPDNRCELLDQRTCSLMDGVWYGDGLCEPNPCEEPPPGACCMPDGSCIFVQQEACPEYADWMGPISYACDPNPCPPCKLPCGEGACCFLDERCEVILEGECESQDGLFMGAAVFCDPNPCAVSSTPDEPPEQNQTWGRIKSLYR